MKRLLFVTTSTTQGGAEKTVYTLATLLDPGRFEIAGVVSLKPKGVYAERLEATGHRVVSLGMRDQPEPFRLLDQMKALGELIREAQPDIVHAVMYRAIQFARSAKLLGFAQFTLVSSPRVHYRTRAPSSLWLDRRLKAADSVLVTESEASRRYLVESMGYDAAKVSTIYNGVDIASWPISRTDRARVRERLKLAAEVPLIGAVGRLDEQKGHRYLIEAFAKLRAAHPAKLLLVGEGPLRRELEGLARQLRVEEDVVFPGEVPDVPAWLSALDVFVLPSLWEGLPNALLEAMAMGLAVAATKVDGVPEAVRHEENGLLVEPGSSQSLFVALQDLALDPALRERLGAEAKRSIKERFTLGDMLARYEGLYAKA